MGFLTAAWGFAKIGLGAAKVVFGGVPLWVYPIIALGLFAGLQTLRYEHAKTAFAVEHANYAEYQKRVAQATAAANVKAIEALRADQVWQEAALALRNSRLNDENDKLNKRLKEIADAPADQDGPVAPILRGSIERLWR